NHCGVKLYVNWTDSGDCAGWKCGVPIAANGKESIGRYQAPGEMAACKWPAVPTMAGGRYLCYSPARAAQPKTKPNTSPNSNGSDGLHSATTCTQPPALPWPTTVAYLTGEWWPLQEAYETCMRGSKGYASYATTFEPLFSAMRANYSTMLN